MPGFTELELAVKLLMVGGFEGGGGSDELPPPHPEITTVATKSMSTVRQSRGARITCLPFRRTEIAPDESTCACYLEAAALERVVIGCPARNLLLAGFREKSKRKFY